MATPLELAQQLAARFPGVCSAPAVFRDEVTVVVAESDRITEVCAVAKKDFGFDYLVDLSGVDNYGDDPRWTVVYELAGFQHGHHLRLKTSVGEERSEVPSVCTVWRAANWHEREAYDMLGIRFRGHPDLRRILMWEGYPYFPLRKDFPLAGRSSEVPEVAFTRPAPLEGGPFVTVAGGTDTQDREPRVRVPDDSEPVRAPKAAEGGHS